ncbi:MAG: pyridoxal phosphate-dependent aminotransferase [Candidatus Latescibacterota bacterium]
MNLSPNVLKIKPSITLAVTARANAMKAQGIDVIPLSAGEPDFGTPKHIADAAIEAIREGFTKYTPTSGIPDLKKAICDKFRRDNGLHYTPSQVIVNNGAKHSDFLAIFVLIGPGDEVIIPAPYWVSYPDMTLLAGGTPVIIEGKPENGLKITPRQLRDAITPKTKLVILNTPSNPTGMIYTEKELRELAEVIVEAGIYVLSDEIYEKLVYDGNRHVSIGSLSEEIFQRTITVNGVSKAYSMTGWRIGYTAGPEEIIRAMDAVQSQETSNPASISQKAALAGLTGPEDFIAEMVTEYDRRRRYMAGRLNGMPGVTCLLPEGAFYVFPDVSAAYGRSYKGKLIVGSVVFCDYMLTEHKIALIPGAGFGADRHVRFSYATSMANIEKALDRFEAGLKLLE